MARTVILYSSSVIYFFSRLNKTDLKFTLNMTLFFFFFFRDAAPSYVVTNICRRGASFGLTCCRREDRVRGEERVDERPRKYKLMTQGVRERLFGRRAASPVNLTAATLTSQEST